MVPPLSSMQLSKQGQDQGGGENGICLSGTTHEIDGVGGEPVVRWPHFCMSFYINDHCSQVFASHL